MDDKLSLKAEGNILIWYIDAAFAVHPDMKSHSGAVFTLGKGAVLSSSTKQKSNARSSTEAELQAVDDKLSKVLWVKRFLDNQGYEVKLNVIYQDNTSVMKLETNGKESSGKRTRHFDIKLFYVTDLVTQKELDIKYCPTQDMLADYITKPLTGSQFVRQRESIMNFNDELSRVEQQECVEDSASVTGRILPSRKSKGLNPQ